MRDGDFIVSKTLPNGLITYCNRIFVEMSGYSESELIGKQHCIIRHPDMPRAVFWLMWETLKSGEEFNGYVKNMRKDGGFYWVFANVTPDFDDSGKLLGYLSVRRKPAPEAIEVVSRIYADMLNAEQSVRRGESIEAAVPVLNSALQQQDLSYAEFALQI